MSIKDITIIIASYKSKEKAINCLESIDNQCKVIIAENSNDLNIKENLEKKYKNVECILTGSNLGYGKANNIALKKVKTKYALILNPDTTLSKSTLQNLIKVSNLIKDFAILAPEEQENKRKISINNKDVFEPKLVKNVKGFAMFFKMSEFIQVGFFDEDFFLYFEDIDLCKRLNKKKKKIYLVANLQIEHLGAQSSDPSIKRERELTRNWHWMWSTFHYHKKYKGFFISLVIIFPKFFSSAIKILIYSLLMNKNKKEIYQMRFEGIINSILGKSSWYRPKIKFND